MKHMINLFFLSLAVACSGEKTAEICDDGKDNDGNELADCDDNACSEDAACVDADGDGSPASLDCDDNEPLAYPDATETCDGVDNNCDGTIDEGLTSTYYADADGDAFGDAANTVEACTVPSGYVADSSDCDDSSSDSYPNAPELCDGLDNDCNDVVDDDPEDPIEFYLDNDSDGYGQDSNTVEACEAPSGYADKGGDCNDTDGSTFPGADELCDGADNDCDADIDEEPVDGTTFYVDADEDGYGDMSTQTTFCEPVSGYVENGDDCDDTTNASNPNAPEICDGLDNDCDGDIDDDDANVINASQTTWYIDSDNDGYGTSTSTIDACVQPSGYAEFDGDCDDSEPVAYPGGPEVCDSIDNDCDGTVDDKPTDGSLYYMDSDGDGYGSDSLTLISCSQPSGYVIQGGDCDENAFDVNPGETETCDGVDNNCSGDENDASDTLIWYQDADADGFGDATSSISTCSQPFGYVSDSTDCVDSDATVYIGAPELCDGIDNDCDGDVDQDDGDFDTANLFSYYVDADGDGFGDDSTVVYDCVQPSGYISLGGDCDDDANDNDGDGVADGYVTNPAAAEVYYDGIDGNCDGMSDYDADMDGDDSDLYNGTDCDDSNANLNTVDFDGDSVSTCDGDCDDDNEYKYPGAAFNEAPPLDTECLLDGDGDGYAGPAEACFSLEVVDTGAYWDNAAIDITLDGVFDSSYTNLGGGSEVYDFCIDPGQVEMTYTCTSTYDCSAHTFYLYDDNGNLLYEDGLDVTGIAPAQITFYSASSISGNDCDDSDASIGPIDVDGDGSSACAGDCDDNDENLSGLDPDGDGYSTCDGDCNESLDDLDGDGVADGFAINPGASEIYGDGIDQNCDGLSDYDQDGDGDDSINDGGTDCDDTDPSVEGLDLDGDGFTTCPDAVTGLADCDDLDEFTYPGAAYNDSATDCLTDVDGDGYAPLQVGDCFTLDMQDSFGDGWNGGALTIYADGVMVDSGLPADSQNQLAGTFYLDTGSAGTLSFCVEGSFLEMSYDSGSWESENTYQLYDSNGILLFDDGPSPATGSVFSMSITNVIPGSGSDCDDNDPAIGLEDADGDGYPSCGGDCDDNDSSVIPVDQDGDGYSVCDGDCNDDPNDPTAININPGMPENYYDGVDENCDGLSDYDADMDGEDSNQYGGTDCDDSDDTIGTGLPEVCDNIDNDCDGLVDDDDSVDPAEVFMWYIDNDGDGYGDDGLSVAQCNPPSGYIADGGDCDDGDVSVNPGASEVYYDGVDSDCDGMSDYDADMDGEDSNLYNGTDCDDSDADLNSLDNDLDGFSSCDGDCDDDNVFTYPGAAFNEAPPLDTECLTDADGDGYAAPLADSCFTLEMQDSWGDGWNGGALTIYADGVMVDSGLPADSQSQLAGTFYLDTGSAGTLSFCAEGNLLELYYDSGSFESENTYQLYDEEGNLIFEDGPSPALGLAFSYDMPFSMGSDCDDTDPAIGATDVDGDGYIDCIDDCDSSDPLALGEELCFDGVDNDCDGLVDCDDSGCDTVCTEYYCDDGIDNDSNGFADCDDSQCEFDPSCFEYECDDGIDDDNDGLTDCDDSDCDGALECMELVCDDGIDDDVDGLADCDDPDCINDAYCFDYCLGGDSDGDGILDNDLLSATGNAVASGTNFGAGDEFQASCSPGVGGEDVVYQWTSPGSGTYTFSTAGSDYDTVIYLLESCVGDELDCNDDVDYVNSDYTSSVDIFVPQGETVTIVIDAYEVTEVGNYLLDVIPSYEPDCGDGVDNDGDGDVDCDDSDCGFDAACAAPTCPNFDLLSLDSMVVTGNNTASSDQTSGSCHGSGGLDFSFAWVAPDNGCLEFDTDGSSYDTSIYILDQCNGSEVACNDDSVYGLQSYLSYDVVAGEDYVLVVDGYSSFSTGDYVMNLLFTPGSSCN